MNDLLILAALTVLGHACQSTLGFGGSFIPVALGAVLFPLGELKLIVVVLNVPTAAWMALRDPRAIDVKALAWPVVPIMAAGIAAGLVLVHHVDEATAKRALGVLVVAVALAGLVSAVRGVAGVTSPWRMRAFVLVGGAMQGAYAAGIPLTVLGLLALPWDRRTRLASVGALCLLVYVALAGAHVVDGSLGVTTWQTCAVLLPAVGVGVVAGELMRDRIPDRPFRIALFTLLVAAGVALVVL